eukprot:364693-Chlamydomonas_euryale.AAC.10
MPRWATSFSGCAQAAGVLALAVHKLRLYTPWLYTPWLGNLPSCKPLFTPSMSRHGHSSKTCWHTTR